MFGRRLIPESSNGTDEHASLVTQDSLARFLNCKNVLRSYGMKWDSSHIDLSKLTDLPENKRNEVFECLKFLAIHSQNAGYMRYFIGLHAPGAAASSNDLLRILSIMYGLNQGSVLSEKISELMLVCHLTLIIFIQFIKNIFEARFVGACSFTTIILFGEINLFACIGKR